VDRDVVFAAVADERRQIASLIDGLDDAQLASPSLCEGWCIKTVAAHLVSVVADSFWVFQRTALRCRSVDRAIDELARRRARLSSAEIAATLRRYADHELSPPITGPLSGLTDVLVHGGDIRIPLGVPFDPDTQRVGLALDFLTGPLPFGFVPRGRLRGICPRAPQTSIGRGVREPKSGAASGSDDGRQWAHRTARQPRRTRGATSAASALLRQITNLRYDRYAVGLRL
jgi:uncharacterized protein (TIGR03083 family)